MRLSSYQDLLTLPNTPSKLEPHIVVPGPVMVSTKKWHVFIVSELEGGQVRILLLCWTLQQLLVVTVCQRETRT
jgi:hypothetical protein